MWTPTRRCTSCGHPIPATGGGPSASASAGKAVVATWSGWRRRWFWPTPAPTPRGKPGIEAGRQAEEDALAGWLAAQPGVVVTSHGGWAPEQWRGSVDGHSFSFRERHAEWRIELVGRRVRGDPLGRVRFLVDTTRTHLRRRTCTVHTARRAEPEQILGRPAAWCPACGQRTEGA